MIHTLKQPWGLLQYNASTHTFSISSQRSVPADPYVDKPVVLNLDLTMRCNMRCPHCVAKAMRALLGNDEAGDLHISKSLMKSINESPFLLIVVTGGECLLPECESSLLCLIDGLKDKGIIIDTNGTIVPSRKMLSAFKKHEVMVRISWDSLTPQYECELRPYPLNLFDSADGYLKAKTDLIRHLIRKGIAVAVQTVVHKKNLGQPYVKEFPRILKGLGVRHWSVQRFIPTSSAKLNKTYLIDSNRDYENFLNLLAKECSGLGITLGAKCDRRHNSVFLLAGDADLFTQSDDGSGRKVWLGKFTEIVKSDSFFEFVSSSEHANRYYMLGEQRQKNRKGKKR